MTEIVNTNKRPSFDDFGEDALDFLSNSGFKRERNVPDIFKPWMRFHEFKRVETIEQLREIVDKCIANKYCSLDLETTGLDNRINYTETGAPITVDQIVGYCICYDGLIGWYVPVRHKPSDGGPTYNIDQTLADAEIKRLCVAAIPDGTPEAKAADPLSWKHEQPPQLVIAFWNAQFDQEFLYPVTGIDWWHPSSFEDGMLAGFCVYSGDKTLGLKPKSKQLLRDADGNPYEMIELKELFPKTGTKKADIQFDSLSPDEPGVLRYAGSDAICTYLLCKHKNLVPTCHQKHAFTYRLEKQTSCALRIMERSRVLINREEVRVLLVEQIAERDQLLAEIKNFAKNARNIDLEPSSPKQLSDFLFEPAPKGINITPKPEKNEASGQYKTDADTLEELAQMPNAPAILKQIVSYREAEKFIGTYLEGLTNNPDSNDEIRVSFKQTGAASGRFSAPAGKTEHGYSGIPIHGIPGGSELRRHFKRRKGYTIAKCDYAAEELRIATNITSEDVWVKEFLYGDGDLHSITARAFFGKEKVTKEERGMGKTANFALIYGGGPQAIIRATGCDMVEAKRRKAAFDKAVNQFATWCKKQKEAVKSNLGVTTPFGRWLALPDANSPDQKIRAAVERHAINYQIQGAGADIMKISMVLLAKKFTQLGWLKNGGDDSIRMLLTVHDEIVFEIRDDRVTDAIPIIVEIMESPWKMPRSPAWKIPLVVEPLVGLNWASGFKAERHKPGHAISSEEVLINGYVYSTIREPKKHKETKKVLERLDEMEQQVTILNAKGEPNEVFQIMAPPWLPEESWPKAKVPGEAPTEVVSPVETIASPMPDVPNEVVSETIPENITADATISVEVQETPKEEATGPRITYDAPKGFRPLLTIKIAILSEKTASQICDAILANIDNEEGVDLQLMDPTETEPIIPKGKFFVKKDDFLKWLMDKNLIC